MENVLEIVVVVAVVIIALYYISCMFRAAKKSVMKAVRIKVQRKNAQLKAEQKEKDQISMQIKSMEETITKMRATLVAVQTTVTKIHDKDLKELNERIDRDNDQYNKNVTLIADDINSLEEAINKKGLDEDTALVLRINRKNGDFIIGKLLQIIAEDRELTKDEIQECVDKITTEAVE